MAAKRRRSKKRAPKQFAATIKAWADNTGDQLLAVQQEAARLVAADVLTPKGQGGNLPVAKGNLRRSLKAATDAMPPVVKAKEFPDNAAQLASTIDGTTLGQTIYLGFQAPYAHKTEYKKGNLFAHLTAQRWPSIVAKAIATVKQRLRG